MQPSVYEFVTANQNYGRLLLPVPLYSLSHDKNFKKLHHLVNYPVIQT